ncbi:MAG: hypothetical protein HY915_06280 [Desulfovibrio sp.]|nr:hypothetical protein [Desulfovibrio sp.]
MGDPPVSISQLIAKRLKEGLDQISFRDWLQGSAIAVPVPKSSLAKPGSLWVPLMLAEAMREAGLVSDVVACLKRKTPLKKSATSAPGERSTVFEHYDSIEVEKTLLAPSEILLIDDIITRGATMLGCANCLQEAFPGVPIRGFAAIRTISNEEDFSSLLAPCLGKISLRGDQSFRNP